jgi:H+/gluconate symporter-like permease
VLCCVVLCCVVLCCVVLCCVVITLLAIVDAEMRRVRRQHAAASFPLQLGGASSPRTVSPNPPLLAPSASVLEGISEACMGDLRSVAHT